MNARTAPDIRKILLIVEDQVLLSIGLRDVDEDGGYRVLDRAMRHREALGYARKEKPDLALVNVELAQGDDGIALARDLEALRSPILFISGQPDRARFC
jgi:DNA-binding NarL/FixJ family response regulator